jgi:hypothetical protein
MTQDQIAAMASGRQEFQNTNAIAGYGGANGPVFMAWEPSLGQQPPQLAGLLAWLYKGFAIANKYGKLACVPVSSNILALPTLVAPIWDVSTTNANALGAFFPRDFCWEAVGKGIYRVKISFAITSPSAGLDVALIRTGLEDSMNLRIGQAGTINSYVVFVNMDASDCVRNSNCCNGDGFFFAPCEEMIPFAIAPESQSMELQGTAPGTAPESYSLQVLFRLYFKPVC